MIQYSVDKREITLALEDHDDFSRVYHNIARSHNDHAELIQQTINPTWDGADVFDRWSNVIASRAHHYAQLAEHSHTMGEQLHSTYKGASHVIEEGVQKQKAHWENIQGQVR